MCVRTIRTRPFALWVALTVVGGVWVFLASAGAALAQTSTSGLFVYPRHGQTVDQQNSDDWQCNRSAIEVTGYDPTNPSYMPPERDLGAQGRTVAKSAVVGSAASSAVGAAAGAVIGEAARGAAMGAAGGGVAGLIRGLFAASRQQQGAQQQQLQRQQQRLQTYQRAYTACMDARGYSVR